MKTRSIRGALAAALALLCTFIHQPPTHGDQFPIMLSLEEEGRTTAIYRGDPITVLVATDTALRFDELAWTMGNAVFDNEPYAGDAQKYMAMDVGLAWYLPGACVDSSGGHFDTVMVTVGGGLIRSNVVTIYVENIPPVLASITIDRIAYPASVLPIYHEVDTARICALTVKATDLDDHTSFSADWAVFRYHTRLLSTTGLTTYFNAPDGGFLDTLYAHVFDGNGGHARQKVVLFNFHSNNKPVFDSIVVDRSVYRGMLTQVFSYRDTVLSTLQMGAFAHDPDGGNVTYTWALRRPGGTLVGLESTAQYAVPDSLLNRNVVDTLYRVDTVDITARDVFNAATVRSVEILLGKPNTAPIIDSVRFPDTLLDARTLTTAALQLQPADLFTFTGFAHDPNPWDSVALYTWTRGSRHVGVTLAPNGRSCDYNTNFMLYADSLTYVDTLTLTVADEDGITDRLVTVLTVANHPPTIDTIRVDALAGGDSVYARAAASYAYPATARDSLVFRGKAGDIDRVFGDRTSISWWNKGAQTTADSLRYKCGAASSTDTVRAVVRDVKGAQRSTMVIIQIR